MNEQEKPLRRSNVLKRLTNLYEKPSYLEVGVGRGTTFNRVPAERKVAVDPRFGFDHEAMGREHPEATYHAVTSDEYFNTIIGADEEFDVIYLDGLHVYDQTLRDLLNALEHLQPQGVIVIDDTRPPTYLASLPDREQFFQLKRATGSARSSGWATSTRPSTSSRPCARTSATPRSPTTTGRPSSGERVATRRPASP